MIRRGETKQWETNSHSLKGKVMVDADCHGTGEEVAAAPSKGATGSQRPAGSPGWADRWKAGREFRYGGVNERATRRRAA
jgi:hypothetical protein